MEDDIYRITYVLNMLPKWGSTKSSTPVPFKNPNAIIVSASLFLKKNLHHPHCFLESPLVISDTYRKEKIGAEISKWETAVIVGKVSAASFL